MNRETIKLLDRVYRMQSKDNVRLHVDALKNAIDRELEAFDLQYKLTTDAAGPFIQARVRLDGTDAFAAMNLLALNHGMRRDPVDILSLHPGKIIHRAKIKSPGKVGFGIFIDIGSKDDKDALYPQFAMREQLTAGKKESTRQIARIHGFCDGFGMEVAIAGHEPGGKTTVELGPATIREFLTWVQDGRDRILCHGELTWRLRDGFTTQVGTTKRFMFQDAGFLDTIVTCDAKTDGAGIIALVGKHFPHVKMGVFNGTKVAKYHQEPDS